MNLDTFSTIAIADELRSLLLGGRVQRVVQINSLTYGFEIFIHPLRHYLIFSAEPQAPRLHLTDHKTRRGVGHDTPLMLVLRKYMRGARLQAIKQPPYERLLYFHFEGPFGATIFGMELLGTRSNLLLLDSSQNILGVARLFNPEGQSGQRTLIPGHLYEPPSPQEKLKPEELTEWTLKHELAEASPEFRLTRLLPELVLGMSRFLAREIVYRATGNERTTVGQLSDQAALLTHFREMFAYLEHHRWEPVLAFSQRGHPRAFAPYPLQHLPHVQPTETFSVAIETYFEGLATGYRAAKKPLQQAIQDSRKRLKRRRKRLKQDAARRPDPEKLREKGEAILAYAHQIESGQKEVIVPWGLEGKSLQITLDPTRSISDNAQQYFARYRKALRSGDEIPAQLKKIDLEESYLDQLEQDLEMADNRSEIDAIAEVMIEARYYRPKRRRKKRSKASKNNYLRLIAPEGARVWVGKNATQNAHLTFHRASADDLWLHARDVPGAHVILPTAEGLPSEEDVFWAAGVAAYYSRARLDTSVEVDVTLKKYVRAIKGAAPGLVTYRNESTFRVAPLDPESDDPVQ